MELLNHFGFFYILHPFAIFIIFNDLICDFVTISTFVWVKCPLSKTNTNFTIQLWSNKYLCITNVYFFIWFCLQLQFCLNYIFLCLRQIVE
nr:MAG TPA: hypothetical protein [Caudoviricetes sp.]